MQSLGKVNFMLHFATPKFHKNPIKLRLISSNYNSININFRETLKRYLKKIFNILK